MASQMLTGTNSVNVLLQRLYVWGASQSTTLINILHTPSNILCLLFNILCTLFVQQIFSRSHGLNFNSLLGMAIGRHTSSTL